MSGSEYEALSDEELSASSSGEEYAASEEEERPRARPGPMRGTGSASGNALRRAAPAPAGGSAPKRPRTAAVHQPKLTDLLKSASKEQLVSLVLELNGEVPGLEGRVAALLPPPDLTVRGWVDRRLPLRAVCLHALPPAPLTSRSVCCTSLTSIRHPRACATAAQSTSASALLCHPCTHHHRNSCTVPLNTIPSAAAGHQGLNQRPAAQDGQGLSQRQMGQQPRQVCTQACGPRAAGEWRGGRGRAGQACGAGMWGRHVGQACGAGIRGRHAVRLHPEPAARACLPSPPSLPSPRIPA